MPGRWGEEPGGPAETLESPAARPGLRRVLAAGVAAGVLVGATGTHELKRRQAERTARSSMALYGLFDSAEAPVPDGGSDVAAGLRVYNGGPLPVTVSGLRLTGSGLAAAGSRSRAPVQVAAHSTSLALALRSDCTGRDGTPLTVTAAVRTADGRSRRRAIPLDHYSDGYLALNAACTEARLQAAAPLPDIEVTVRSAQQSGAGPRSRLLWRLQLSGEPGITVRGLALGGSRLTLAPHGLPVTFGPTRTAEVSAAVRATPCRPGPLQSGDFLLTWTAYRRTTGGTVQQRLANISGVPPTVVLRTSAYARQVCGAAD